MIIKKNGFSFIEIIFALIILSIIITGIYPALFIQTDISRANILKEKSIILLNNTAVEMQSIKSDSIAIINGLYSSDSYGMIPDFPEFRREIYIYDEIVGDTNLKRVHIFSDYYIPDKTKKEIINEFVLLRNRL